MSAPQRPDALKNAAAARRFAPEKMQKVNLFETDRMFCDLYCLQPGQAQKVHAHAGADKMYYVLEGEATFTLGEDQITAGADHTILAEADVPHGVRNASDGELVCLVFMAPNPNV